MKQISKIIYFLALGLIVWCNNVAAQSPVALKYTSKKVANNIYEVHITATIEPEWHLYSQTSHDKGGRPAEVNFIQNPLISLEGGVREVGELKSQFEELFGVTVKYFEQRVDFVQKVKLKVKAKTNIMGSLTYMVCNDRECMPPTTKKFSIALL